MSIGSGIAVAGWFVAFVMAAQISENMAVGLIVAGIFVAIAHRIG